MAKRERAKLEYNSAFQERIVRLMVNDQDWCLQFCVPHLDPTLFENRIHCWIADRAISYATKYQTGITREALRIEAKHAFVSGRLVRKRDKPIVMALLAKLRKPVPDRSYIKRELFRFIKTQTLKDVLLNDVTDLVKSNDVDSYDGALQRILDVQAPTEGGLGHFMSEHRVERYKRRKNWEADGIATGLEVDNSSKYFGARKKQLCAVVAPPHVGKCLAPETMVLKYDGTQVRADRVCTGDLLMGPDSKPRLVTSVCRGESEMFKIIPVRGEPWVCNDVHMLSLVWSGSKKGQKLKDGDSVDVPLNEYMQLSRHQKHHWKLFQPKHVEFPPSLPPPIDPYFLGMWFGDGSKGIFGDCSVGITNNDIQTQWLCNDIAKVWGLRVRTRVDARTGASTHFIVDTKVKPNKLLNQLRKLVSTNKTIPNSILVGSREVREQFLAGVLDADGHKTKAGYEFAQKRVDYAEAIAFVARSLGMRVTSSPKIVNGTVYRRLYIAGDAAHHLPLRIPRKKLDYTFKHQHNPLRTAFTVRSCGVGPYAGFTLDGDGRFLLGDFTVTHNTTILCHLAKQAVMLANKRVLVVSLEEDDVTIQDRLDSAFTGVAVNDLEKANNPRKIRRFWRRFKKTHDHEMIVVKEFPMGVTTVAQIERYIKSLERKGFYPDVVFVDYAGLVKPEGNLDDSRYEEIGTVYVELRSLAQRLKILVWTAHQGNRASMNKKIITMKDLAESFKPAMHADILLAVCQTEQERSRNGRARIYTMKFRGGKSHLEFPIRIDYGRVRVINRGEANG